MHFGSIQKYLLSLTGLPHTHPSHFDFLGTALSVFVILYNLKCNSGVADFFKNLINAPL